MNKASDKSVLWPEQESNHEGFQRLESAFDENDIDFPFKKINRREREIDQITIKFISDLMLSKESTVPEEDLEDIKDEIERVLAGHGIVIYRPAIIRDGSHDEHVVSSIYA